jgi:hypothetical protein
VREAGRQFALLSPALVRCLTPYLFVCLSSSCSFSYCWKVEPENVRTLAKAVWRAGVGVWIDVVKLCPGDEIRPMVRTTVRRVHKVV